MTQSLTWKHILLAPVFALAVSSNAWATTYTFTTLDPTGSISTEARGINNAGQIVGSFGDATGTHGYLRDSSGVFTSLDVPGAPQTQALGINDMGQVVGTFSDPSGNHHPGGFLYTGGGYSILSPPGVTDLVDINNSGQIVGGLSSYQGFLLDTGGSLTTINFPGSSITDSRSINDAGQIVGRFFDGGGVHGYLRDAGGTFSAHDFPGASATTAYGINNDGQIVGTFQVGGAGGHQYGYFYDAGTFSLIDVPGSTDTHALGLNDAGLIVGVYADSAGNAHGFLATPDTAPPPVPEPSTMLLFGSGLAGLAMWRRKRQG